MTRIATLGLLAMIAPVWGAEPLAGHWLLKTQEVGGQRRDNPDPLLLRVTPSGNALEFAYSVPVTDVQFVALKFTPRLDGTEADMINSQGTKIGSVKVTKPGPRQYKIVIRGPNRPSATGTMTVSADGKTLTSTSDSEASDKAPATHTVQVFSRRK